MNKFTKYMTEYIESFHHLGNQEKNDQQFIEEFTEWLRSLEYNCFEFEGNNDYCGFTVQVYKEDPRYNWGYTSCNDNYIFEISYRGCTSPVVKVYTANHHGFWVPEYIDLTGDDCDEILGIIKNNLEQWGGF